MQNNLKRNRTKQARMEQTESLKEKEPREKFNKHIDSEIYTFANTEMNIKPQNRKIQYICKCHTIIYNDLTKH